MARIIKMSQEDIELICEGLKKMMVETKLADGKLSFSKTFGEIERKAELFFSERAYLKMEALVKEFDKEVAWHGIAFRGDDPEKDEYIIEDILVYPQEVTGANVNTDQKEYQEWLYSDELDAVFNDIRMQGHSHVNMGVTPSSVDTNLYEHMLAQLDDTMFYIFMIWNKRGEHTIKIYDLAKNVLFEDKDVTVSIIDEEIGLDKFIKEAKEMVKTKTYTTYYKKDEKPDKKDTKVDTSKQRGGLGKSCNDYNGFNNYYRKNWNSYYDYYDY